MNKKHIGIIFQGNHEWIAGFFYIKHLLVAINSLSKEEKNNISLSLIAINVEKNMLEQFRNLVNQVIEIPAWKLLIQKGKNRLLKNPSILDYRFFKDYKFDFIYPYISSDNVPFAWGGWIPDFQHIHLPNYFSKREIQIRDLIFAKIAKYASTIILSSNMAKKDFCRLYPDEVNKSQVMQFSSYFDKEWLLQEPSHVQLKYKLPDRFFLVCNQFWKHKDHIVIIEALKILKKDKVYPIIVCTGKTEDYRYPNYITKLISLIKNLDLESQFYILGFIPRIDQIQLMRKAMAVIQPSLFEGWSTVVEDARALGKPMILSDFPVHIEQDPPYSDYFERNNPEKLASLIKNYHLELKEGPCSDREAIAQIENEKRIRAFGRRFLEIAFSVV